MMTESEKYVLRLSRSWNAGNYANAYESEDYATAWEMQDLGEYDVDAFLVGFFASYEWHEIPGHYQDQFWNAWHSPEGKICRERGWCDPRPEMKEDL